MTTLYLDEDAQTLPSSATTATTYTFTSATLSLDQRSTAKTDSTCLNLLNHSGETLICLSFSRSNDEVVLNSYSPREKEWGKEIRLPSLERAFGHDATTAIVQVKVYDRSNWQISVNGNYLATFKHSLGGNVNKASYTSTNNQGSVFNDPVTLDIQ